MLIGMNVSAGTSICWYRSFPNQGRRQRYPRRKWHNWDLKMSFLMMWNLSLPPQAMVAETVDTDSEGNNVA